VLERVRPRYKLSIFSNAGGCGCAAEAKTRVVVTSSRKLLPETSSPADG
jgi:hypothetical protein